LLNIDLQDGFTNDDVQIKVNGRQVYHRDALTTQRLLGLADSTQVAIEDGAAEVEIAVTSRGISRKQTVQLKGDLHLGVALEGASIRLHQSSKPFGYA
jgi:hypothetical protein